MTLSSQIANQFREIHLNGEWVVTTNLKKELEELTWQEAITKINNLNTIATLAFHINYYVAGILNVLEGGTLDIKDKYSFDHTPITCKNDWDLLLKKMWRDAESLAILVNNMPESIIFSNFANEKYGNYFKNIQALIEHIYYHLGQIILIKKMVRA